MSSWPVPGIKSRLPCPECHHGSYLFGCTCTAQACICRKRRELNESSSDR